MFCTPQFLLLPVRFFRLWDLTDCPSWQTPMQPSCLVWKYRAQTMPKNFNLSVCFTIARHSALRREVLHYFHRMRKRTVSKWPLPTWSIFFFAQNADLPRSSYFKHANLSRSSYFDLRYFLPAEFSPARCLFLCCSTPTAGFLSGRVIISGQLDSVVSREVTRKFRKDPIIDIPSTPPTEYLNCSTLLPSDWVSVWNHAACSW